MRRARRMISAAALTALAIAAPADASSKTTCREVRAAVAVELGEPADRFVAGTLCRPPGADTLQVLLSGATYGRGYWHMGSSYVRSMNRAGFATLSLDRIGIGASDRPPAEAVTVTSNALVAHGVIRAARDGSLGAKFERVVAVGHSLGSAVALVAAARLGDVDGLILSGFLAHAQPVGAPAFAAALEPAQLDPRLAARPAGYLTTRAGTRGSLFYATAAADAGVVALDEQTKETVTVGELMTLHEASQHAVDAAIRVPVLSVVGEFDNVFCATSCLEPGSPAFAEAARYPNAPSFQTFVLPRAGHAINLHRGARAWLTAARAWLRREFGSGLAQARCRCMPSSHGRRVMARTQRVGSRQRRSRFSPHTQRGADGERNGEEGTRTLDRDARHERAIE